MIEYSNMQHLERFVRKGLDALKEELGLKPRCFETPQQAVDAAALKFLEGNHSQGVVLYLAKPDEVEQNPDSSGDKGLEGKTE